MGLVLNRPSETTVGSALPDLADVAGYDAPVFIGGPVQADAVIVLAEFDDAGASAGLVVGDIGFARADGDLGILGEATRRARVFAGHSGWAPGQLEAELDETSWLVEPAEGVDVLADPRSDLFGDVLRRKGGGYRLLATMPEDPRQN